MPSGGRLIYSPHSLPLKILTPTNGTNFWQESSSGLQNERRAFKGEASSACKGNCEAWLMRLTLPPRIPSTHITKSLPICAGAALALPRCCLKQAEKARLFAGSGASVADIPAKAWHYKQAVIAEPSNESPSSWEMGTGEAKGGKKQD